MKKLRLLLAAFAVILVGAIVVLAQSDLHTADYSAAGWSLRKQNHSTEDGMAAFVTVAEYYFPQDGGAVGDIDLGVRLDKGWIIWDGIIDIIETLEPRHINTTNTLWILTAGDILAAYTNNFTDSEELLAIVPLGTAATALSMGTNVESTLKLNIGGHQAVTSGHFRVMMQGFKSN